MNRNALTAAIKLAQLTKLVAPTFSYSKNLSKAFSRIRSRLESLVGIAATHQDGAVIQRAEEYIERLYLYVLEGVQTHFNVAVLLDIYLENKKSSLPAFKTPSHKTSIIETAFNHYLDLSPELMPHGQDKDALARNKAIQLFSSIVRNSSWMPLLNELKIDMSYPVMSMHCATLLRMHGSQQGVSLVSERVAALLANSAVRPNAEKQKTPITSKKKSALKLSAAGLYKTQAMIDATTLLSLPEMSVIFAAGQGLESDKALESLIEKLVQPIPLAPEDSAEARVQEKLDQFCDELALHQKKIEAARKARQKERDEKQKQIAVQALKQLDPKLLKLLRENPDLLKSV